ncbi:DNA-binding protein [Lysinibacillus fusiformis]|uniref:DNA-binding protein n=1 Tax=Lysinibacillus fusiformis TaxID=28031 RepID=UPI003D0489F0
MQGVEAELLKSIMEGVINEIVGEFKAGQKEWFTLNEAAEYIGIAPNTLKKLRTYGLPVCEIEGTSVKRVSRKAIDKFMNEYSN